jgi:hypothetical protein
MQTWITDKDFYKSASNLDTRRLQANIYESIQILASLIDCSDKLVNPKRNVKNYPQAKLWKGYERELYIYIGKHILVWEQNKYKYDYSTITYRNYEFIIFNKLVELNIMPFLIKIPKWITDELIQVHRSVLIQKKPDYYKKLWPDVSDNLKMRYDWR